MFKLTIHMYYIKSPKWPVCQNGILLTFLYNITHLLLFVYRLIASGFSVSLMGDTKAQNQQKIFDFVPLCPPSPQMPLSCQKSQMQLTDKRKAVNVLYYTKMLKEFQFDILAILAILI